MDWREDSEWGPLFDRAIAANVEQVSAVLGARVDASRPSQVTIDPPFGTANHAGGVGPLDLETVFGDEDELALVEQQRAMTNLETEHLHDVSSLS